MKPLFLIMATSMALAIPFSSVAKGINFQHISLSEAIEKSEAENKPIFIDVYADWCGPCKYLSKNVFVDNDLGEYMNENFINLKLDGEVGDGLSVALDFGVEAYPTMLFISTDKLELDRIVGAVDADEIIDVAKGVINPESTELFQMTQKYAEGNRDQQFLLEYASLLLNKDEDFEPVVREYLELYPDIDLEDEGEFLIFCLGIDDLTDPLSEKFLQDIEYYNVLHEELTVAKMRLFLI